MPDDPVNLDETELLPTRRSLLSRLKDWNDQESWRQFFDTYWRLIYRAAVKAGLNPDEAHDVVQEPCSRWPKPCRASNTTPP